MKKGPKTHCKRGHLLEPDNIYISPKTGSRGCRKCRSEQHARWLKGSTLTANAARKIFCALQEGKTLRNIFNGKIGSRPRTPGMKVAERMVFNRFCLANPRWLKKIKPLIEINEARARSLNGPNRRIIAAPALMKNDGDAAYDAVMAATRSVWEGIRDDVIGDMFLAVGEGRLPLRDIHARVGEFVTAHNRRERNSVFSKFGHLSLDKPIFEDGSTKLGDTITQGIWD